MAGVCSWGEVIVDDLTTLEVDAIVNAANETLLGGVVLMALFAGLPASTRATPAVRAFGLAQDAVLSSSAFAAIRTSVSGYPMRMAANIAIAAMREHASAFERVAACRFSSANAAVYRAALACG